MSKICTFKSHLLDWIWLNAVSMCVARWLQRPNLYHFPHHFCVIGAIFFLIHLIISSKCCISCINSFWTNALWLKDKKVLLWNRVYSLVLEVLLVCHTLRVSIQKVNAWKIGIWCERQFGGNMNMRNVIFGIWSLIYWSHSSNEDRCTSARLFFCYLTSFSAPKIKVVIRKYTKRMNLIISIVERTYHILPNESDKNVCRAIFSDWPSTRMSIEQNQKTLHKRNNTKCV